MKIFGIGLARTGTASLNRALKILGHSSRHFPRTYEEVLEHDCATDTSVTLGYRYLDFMFPGAKFILTTRPVDDWLGSMRSLFEHLNAQAMADRYHRLHQVLYGTTVYDEGLLRQAHLRHEEEARAHFRSRPGSLLVLDLTAGDGFAQLCPFLGAEPPGEPFPHRNDRSALRGSRPAFGS
ncbi:sulfotransferase family protein [Streptomyces sp. MP131-18]|uniref:sulfotransferase family protein n=1 Tax=Streptomyces sp. MP131-18 TaxID=1857892 RepID=UPI00097BE668|nr:sulfotransferase family protein [Streptomyces sp. MP131-18]ONK15811.1 hypothetical protein STBA_66520 [Streptomyces sp. MP131-18]